MTDFVEFLNNADADSLNKLSSLTPIQVESILSARPFSSLEDCTRISKMTKTKLAKLQTVWETGQVAAPVEEAKQEVLDSEPKPVEIEPVENDVQEPAPPKKNGNLTRILWRVLLAVVILAGLALALYYGIPFLYEKYVRPVETNSANISDLAKQQETEIARLDGEIVRLEEIIAAAQADITTLQGRSDDFDKALETVNTSLANLDSMQRLLGDQLTSQKDELLSALDQQVKFTRALELISRSRLYLSQSNNGLAKADLQASRGLLYTMLETLPEGQVNAMKIVIDRLDLAISNLPAYPVVAVYDVDIAWQLLVDGLPNVPEQALTPVVLPQEETAVPETTETTVPTAAP